MGTRELLGGRAPDAERRLRRRLAELKRRAREIDPENFWLQTSDLTDLGYVRLVLQVARALTADGRDPRRLSVLDWGGGPGFLSYLLEGFGFATTYYDYRYDYPSYRFVLESLQGRVLFVDDPTKLPFDDGAFAAVISCGVLEHVHDPAGSLDEVSRVLVPAGRLFVYHFPNRHSYIEGLAKLFGKRYHEYKLSRRELERLLTAHGFAVLALSYRYIFPRNLSDWPRARGFMNRHADALFALDAALSRLPALRGLSTTLNAVCLKP
jgi:SAM-dependent methyltransferase